MVSTPLSCSAVVVASHASPSRRSGCTLAEAWQVSHSRTLSEQSSSRPSPCSQLASHCWAQGAEEDRWAFNTEWTDPLSGVLWRYQLLFYPHTQEVEMVRLGQLTGTSAQRS